MTKSALIVAVDKNYGIGIQNRLPWKSKADMQFFRKTTENSVCIMGRKTYESIAVLRKDSEPLLPNRECIVVSKSLSVHDLPECANTYLAEDVAAAYALASKQQTNIFFIGGRSIYEQCVPYIDTAYVNMLLDDYKCDTFFPENILDNFKLSRNHEQLATNLLAFEYKKKDK
jgi:dihydrofolate reductase